MCGLVGFWQQATRAPLEETIHKMASRLQHRGPDDEGVWIDAEQGLALGFRRLAILDLSPEGHQPMQSAGGRFVMVFNGEVYNFLELRQELEGLGCRFRGHSDTEIMLAAIDNWGVEKAISRFHGMFGLAVWDQLEKRLWLARDRVGIKPVYYGWMGNTLLFGSELKSFRPHPDFQPQIDLDSLTLFMRYNVVPAPYSIFENIFQLPPGNIICLTSSEQKDVAPHAYWSLAEMPGPGSREIPDEEAIDCLDELLRRSVRLHMLSDVPLGAFLSGGIDSSTVVALMQAQSGRPVKTFSIGFHEANYDESGHARLVANHLGTEHTELFVAPEDALNVIPLLPEIYDEPFGDWSQIPTYLLSKLTREHVTVSLSGDGGDELFAGYAHYPPLARAAQSMRKVPAWVRRPAGKLLGAASQSAPGRWLDWVIAQRSPFTEKKLPHQKVAEFSDVLQMDSIESMYHWAISYWRNPTELVLGGEEPASIFSKASTWQDLRDPFHRMMYIDLMSYLPNDILVKVDRASMAVALESRVPLLDHPVVEFAWSLPLHQKFRTGQGKWLLRQVLNRYVPAAYVDRPKQGFSLPLHAWLRGPLREWAEAMLSEERLAREGFLNPQLVREKWQEHLSGRRSWLRSLWNVLMFQAWREHWLN